MVFFFIYFSFSEEFISPRFLSSGVLILLCFKASWSLPALEQTGPAWLMLAPGSAEHWFLPAGKAEVASIASGQERAV